MDRKFKMRLLCLERTSQYIHAWGIPSHIRRVGCKFL